jgi:periplasmic copper chaperone A
MKPIVLLLALALASLATAAAANDYKLGTLEIQQPWTRATPKGAKTAAGYLAIRNTGSAPDRLTGGSLTGAGGAQVHEMTMDHGVMKMRAMPDGVEIKPGETVELKPGGLHIMFTDLKARLVKGQSVKGTLTFANAGTVDVEFAIQAIGATGGTGADHMHMDHMQMH